MRNDDIIELDDGYYFNDGQDGLEGPFKSLKQCQTALDAYVKWINHDHQEYGIRKMRNNYD